MRKGIALAGLVLAVIFVLSSIAAMAAPPAPPSLPSATGNVRKDYVDQASPKKVYYTVEKPDGTMVEFWTDRKEVDELTKKAAETSRKITVWYEEDGEAYGVSTHYPSADY